MHVALKKLQSALEKSVENIIKTWSILKDYFFYQYSFVCPEIYLRGVSNNPKW